LSIGKISSTAWTVEFAIASALTSSVAPFGGATGEPMFEGAGAAVASAAAVTMVTGMGRPATFSATVASQAF
jgi:hypothetical protein